jgi:hypothetical protein
MTSSRFCSQSRLIVAHAVFPHAPPQQSAEQVSKMRRVALQLMVPSLSECVQQWVQECREELGTPDLNKVCRALLLLYSLDFGGWSKACFCSSRLCKNLAYLPPAQSESIACMHSTFRVASQEHLSAGLDSLKDHPLNILEKTIKHLQCCIPGALLPPGGAGQADVQPVPQEHREPALHMQELPQRCMRHLLC